MAIPNIAFFGEAAPLAPSLRGLDFRREDRGNVAAKTGHSLHPLCADIFTMVCLPPVVNPYFLLSRSFACSMVSPSLRNSLSTMASSTLR